MTEPAKPPVGIAQQLEPGIRRILAPNPSPMTYWGTNTYFLGHKDITVIDPGPNDAAHLEAILKALEGDQTIKNIVVTHAHLDHSPLGKTLSKRVGAKVLAFGGPQAGRSAVMMELAANGFMGGGEGVDSDFEPDHEIANGALIPCELGDLEVIHTPGHFGNHISLSLGDRCFTGDHVMGWASSLVSPPDGDLTDFMKSCETLAAREWRVFYAGHGAPIFEPNERLAWLIDHRRSRETDILNQLDEGPDTAEGLAKKIYTDVDPRLLPAASRNVFAHLVDLNGRRLIETTQPIGFKSTFQKR